MTAYLEVRNALQLGGRGAVLIGYVRAGRVEIGQVTDALQIGRGPERSLEVVAIQRLAAAEPGGSAVGLVFRDPPSFADLEATLARGRMLALHQAGSQSNPPHAGG